jgi:hypothetical protein
VPTSRATQLKYWAPTLGMLALLLGSAAFAQADAPNAPQVNPSTAEPNTSTPRSEGAATGSAPTQQLITDSEVDAAVAKVKSDPNLSQEKTIKTLRFRRDEDDNKERKSSSGFKWLGDLFSFVAQTGRVIAWLAIGAVLVLLIYFIAKVIRSIEPRIKPEAFVAPTHVRDLDIRPESLPDDIGAAAKALWERGEHRAALALLYRGLLSRLVHVHAVAIRHSSTEGDCLALSIERLPQLQSDYVANAIRTWQRAVYGAQLPQTETVQALCSGFAIMNTVMPKDMQFGSGISASSPAIPGGAL